MLLPKVYETLQLRLAGVIRRSMSESGRDVFDEMNREDQDQTLMKHVKGLTAGLILGTTVEEVNYAFNNGYSATVIASRIEVLYLGTVRYTGKSALPVLPISPMIKARNIMFSISFEHLVGIPALHIAMSFGKTCRAYMTVSRLGSNMNYRSRLVGIVEFSPNTPSLQYAIKGINPEVSGILCDITSRVVQFLDLEDSEFTALPV